MLQIHVPSIWIKAEYYMVVMQHQNLREAAIPVRDTAVVYISARVVPLI